MIARTRRPHYQERRAHADGWEVEYSGYKDKWISTSNPDWTADRYQIVPDADGWLPWYGSEDGKGPFEGNPMVEVVFKERALKHCIAYASRHAWGWANEADDIILYRLHKEDPKPKVKMWQWIYKGLSGAIVLTNEFYSDKPNFPAAKIIGPAIWTEIEV